MRVCHGMLLCPQRPGSYCHSPFAWPIFLDCLASHSLFSLSILFFLRPNDSIEMFLHAKESSWLDLKEVTYISNVE